MWAILCDEKGETLCGTDGHLWIPKTYTMLQAEDDAAEYRKRFKKNFLHKYNFWTHFMLCKEITEKGKPIRLKEL